MFTAAGVAFSYLINRLIISRVIVDAGFSFSPPALLPLPFLAYHAWTSTSPVHVVVMSRVYLVFTIVVYAHFVQSVIHEICTFLKIRAFVIAKKSN